MENGYVKFFDTREGKLFGFLVDDNGLDLFFHYTGGCAVGLNRNQEVVLEEDKSSRYPKNGDYLMFERGRNAKGPMARKWCFEKEYNDLVEKSKRDLTLEEARKHLADKTCNILEYTSTTREYGTVITTLTTKITWLTSDVRQVAASGEFVVKTTRYSSGDPDVKSDYKVSMYAPSPNFKQTMFSGENALALKDLGKKERVVKGAQQGILWNGGWDEYVIDTNSVRDMTDDELDELGNSSYPTSGGEKWLRCLFTQGLGHDLQVVRILAHLGSGE